MAKGIIAEGAHIEIKLADASEDPQIALDMDWSKSGVRNVHSYTRRHLEIANKML